MSGEQQEGKRNGYAARSGRGSVLSYSYIHLSTGFECLSIYLPVCVVKAVKRGGVLMQQARQEDQFFKSWSMFVCVSVYHTYIWLGCVRRTMRGRRVAMQQAGEGSAPRQTDS